MNQYHSQSDIDQYFRFQSAPQAKSKNSRIKTACRSVVGEVVSIAGLVYLSLMLLVTGPKR